MRFKMCTTCGKDWLNRDRFLADPDVRVVGYQPNFVDLKGGIFLFNHRARKCGTTLAIRVGKFADLYRGPMYQRRPEIGGDGCPGFCLYQDSIKPCPEKCDCAYVRHVLRLVGEWPKKSAGGRKRWRPNSEGQN